MLGAQGPRTVRSTKMEDVIFAGSANRAALGRAEVTLTIDNSAGLLPIDFAEVTISRTLVPRVGRERIRDQRRAVPPARHPGAAVGLRRGPSAARDRQPGPARRRAQRAARGPPGDHRRGGRRAQVPPPPREGAAPAGVDRGQPGSTQRPVARSSPSAQAARTPGRRGPSSRRRRRRARERCASSSPGAKWPHSRRGSRPPTTPKADAGQDRSRPARRTVPSRRARHRRPRANSTRRAATNSPTSPSGSKARCSGPTPSAPPRPNGGRTAAAELAAAIDQTVVATLGGRQRPHRVRAGRRRTGRGRGCATELAELGCTDDADLLSDDLDAPAPPGRNAAARRPRSPHRWRPRSDAARAAEAKLERAARPRAATSTQRLDRRPPSGPATAAIGRSPTPRSRVAQAQVAAEAAEAARETALATPPRRAGAQGPRRRSPRRAGRRARHRPRPGRRRAARRRRRRARHPARSRRRRGRLAGRVRGRPRRGDHRHRRRRRSHRPRRAGQAAAKARSAAPCWPCRPRRCPAALDLAAGALGAEAGARPRALTQRRSRASARRAARQRRGRRRRLDRRARSCPGSPGRCRGHPRR